MVEDVKSASPSIGVHVRRGDFLDLGATISVDYYQAAVLKAEQRFNSSTYFIFSDGIDWSKNDFKFIENKRFVEGWKDYIDLKLHQRCDHQITANSTFSWWAAWLNEKENKKIYTPYLTETSDDFVLKDWRVVEY